jgi:hypothetical protein
MKKSFSILSMPVTPVAGRFLIPVLVVLLLATSCQKEISGDGFGTDNKLNPLLGTWKFINSHVSANATVEITNEFSDVKSITLTEYSTLNNKGTVVIDDTAMTSTGISYDVLTISKSYTYLNGNLEDSTDFPIAFSIPSSSYKNSYKRIGTDSINSAGGVFTQVVSSPAGTMPSAGGYRYRLSGDTLTLTASIDEYSLDTSMGVPIKTWNKAQVTTTLGK